MTESKIESIAETSVKDPLSETTRKERRSLLGISIIVIAIVKTGIIPTKIEALGVEFSQTHQKYLFNILSAVVIYYLVAFIIYAIADFISWRIAYSAAWFAKSDIEMKTFEASEKNKQPKSELELLREQVALYKGEEERRRLTDFDVSGFFRPNFLIKIAGIVSLIRSLFEFVLPLAVGTYAFCLLIFHRPSI